MDFQEKSVDIPNNRMSFIRKEWLKIYTPIVEISKLQIRMNFLKKRIEFRTCNETTDVSYINRAEQFIRAICIGFSIDDSLAIMKFPDVFLDNFNMHEVKTLKNLHVDRAIGRMIGREGKTKDTIENLTITRVVIKDSEIFLLGPSENTRIARDAFCRLIMGSKPGTIYTRLRNYRSKIKDKYGSIQVIYNELQKVNE